MVNSYNSNTTKPIYYGTKIVWYILGFIETLLIFRFVLKVLAANTSAGFSRFIYDISQPFAYPFINVFRITKVDNVVFEWSTLLAVAVYWLIAWGIVRLFFISKTVSTPEAAAKLDN